MGGPIKENYLWFFGSMYKRASESYVLDRFFDLNEPSTPDGVTADDLCAALDIALNGQGPVNI